jgi:hypothetical protein
MKTRAIIRAAGLALMLLSPSGFAQVDAGAPEPVEARPSNEQEARRFIWGVGSLGGPFFYAFPLCMPLVGVEVSLGFQWRRWLGVLGTIGVAGGMSKWDYETQVALLAKAGVLVELSLFQRIFAALGPALVVGSWGDLGSYRYGSVRAGGLVPSLDLRLGVGLWRGDAHAGQRRQFTLGVDVLILFASASYLRETPGGGIWSIGLQSESLVSVAPTLMLTYDAR